MSLPQIIVIAYLAVVSVISVVLCLYDKFASKLIKRHRAREATLLLLSALGGSVAMLVTMLIFRHKTKHLKFMIGIPVIIILQAALALALYVFI